MDGIKQTLDAAGACFKDVVHMFVFRARPQMGDIERPRVINRYFAPFNHKPTSTNIAVLELGEPEQLIEIQMSQWSTDGQPGPGLQALVAGNPHPIGNTPLRFMRQSAAVLLGGDQSEREFCRRDDEWGNSLMANGARRTSLSSTMTGGSISNTNSVFRNRIGNETGFPPEPGRYHLYCAVACPWAHRATLMRTLKQLEPFITLTDTFQEPDGQGGRSAKETTSCPGPIGVCDGCMSSMRSPIRPAPPA